MENQYKYTVCIHCMTYNHENYLADALEGFVMQKTTFPFVAVVIDDFSTDGTADVLRKYEAKYPDIIKAVYLTENYYSQRKSKEPFLKPYDSQTKYIAMCEGDDYWTDLYKLQKQVDFLESHPDYSVCFCRCLHHYVNTGKTTSDTNCDKWLTPLDPGVEITKSMFFDKWITQPLTMVYRSSFDASKFRAKYTHYWDTYMIYELLNCGKGALLNFYGGVYNVTGTGMASSLSIAQSCQFELTSANELHKVNHTPETKVYWQRTLIWSINTYKKHKQRKLLLPLYKSEFNLFKGEFIGFLITYYAKNIKHSVKSLLLICNSK